MHFDKKQIEHGKNDISFFNDFNIIGLGPWITWVQWVPQHPQIMELRSYGITATDGQTDVEVEIVF